MLRTYEALYIIQPDLGDDEIQAVAKQVESLITDNGGSIVRSEIWGKRKLAYQVDKWTEGCYVLLRYEAPAEFNKRLENYFRLSDSVIRFLITYFDEQTLRLEEEQQKRKQAEIQASASRGRDDDDDDDRPSRPRQRVVVKDETEEE